MHSVESFGIRIFFAMRMVVLSCAICEAYVCEPMKETLDLRTPVVYRVLCTFFSKILFCTCLGLGSRVHLILLLHDRNVPKKKTCKNDVN